MTYLETTAKFYAEVAVCDKTANNLATKFPQEVIITDSTWHYNSGGCCYSNLFSNPPQIKI